MDSVPQFGAPYVTQEMLDDCVITGGQVVTDIFGRESVVVSYLDLDGSWTTVTILEVEPQPDVIV